MKQEIFNQMMRCYDAGDEKSKAVLNQLLLENPEERKAFIMELMDEDIIVDELKALQVEQLYSVPKVDENLGMKSRKPLSQWIPLTAVAALLCVMVATGMYYFMSSAEQDSVLTKTEKSDATIAQLIATTTDTQWASKLQTGDDFIKGHYEMMRGNAHIKFSNGVELSIDGPAEIELIDAFKVVLHKGRVRAHVPDSGYGFQIDTPDIDIRDLGTEFGVEVFDGKDTKVNVYDGEIELYTDFNSEPILAKEGYSARWIKGSAESSSQTPESDFPSLRSIGYERWKVYHQEQLSSPDLALALDFKDGEQTIPSLVSNGFSAHCSDPLKVRGRWYRDSAYVIDSWDQGIELPDITIDGDFTIQAWIYPDLFEASLRVVMNTETYQSDSLHWQISRDGNLRAGFKGVKRRTRKSPQKLHVGEWNQVTLTYDAEKGILSSYANGQLVETVQRTAKSLPLKGARIGVWRKNVGSNVFRFLSGKVDEFTIRRRAMEASEILHSYKLGSPH